jgi:hypothetical protein
MLFSLRRMFESATLWNHEMAERHPWWNQRLGVLAVAALVLFLRKTDSFVNPQFWAEDYWPFFADAELHGASVICAPYAGYLHLLPRLIAWSAAHFDPLFSPAVYVWASLGLTLFVVAQVMSDRLALPGRPLLALSLVLVPGCGEIFLNPTNLQWITAFGLLVTFFKRDPVSWSDWVTDGFALIGFGLTGPFSVLFIPLVAYRALSRRSQASWMLCAVALSVASAQFYVWWISHASVPPLMSGPWDPTRAPLMIEQRSLGQLLLGKGAATSAPPLVDAGIGLVALVALVLGLKARKSERPMLGALALVAGIELALVTFRARPDLWAVTDMENGERYFYMPKVIALWWVTILGFSLGETPGTRRWWRGFGYGVLTWILLINYRDFRFPPLPDLHWAEFAAEVRKGKAVVIPTNPGWRYRFPGRNRK